MNMQKVKIDRAIVECMYDKLGFKGIKENHEMIAKLELHDSISGLSSAASENK